MFDFNKMLKIEEMSPAIFDRKMERLHDKVVKEMNLSNSFVYHVLTAQPAMVDDSLRNVVASFSELDNFDEMLALESIIPIIRKSVENLSGDLGKVFPCLDENDLNEYSDLITFAIKNSALSAIRDYSNSGLKDFIKQIKNLRDAFDG